VLGHILNFVGKSSVTLVDITYSKVKKILYWMLEKLNQLVIAAVKVSPYIGIS